MVELEGGTYESKGDNYDTIKLFQNPYSLGVYNEILVYIPDEPEMELVGASIQSLARLDAWIKTVVECFFGAGDSRWKSSKKVCGHIWKEHETGSRAGGRTDSSVCSVVRARRNKATYIERRPRG